MINPVTVQAAIITLMKAQPTLTALVTTSDGVVEIREDSWMGKDFKYPNYRVSMPRIDPVPGNNGACHFLIGTVNFSIYCFAEGTSSRKALELSGAVTSALINKVLSGFSTYSRIDLVSLPEPVQEGERLWRSEVQFSTSLKET